MKFISKVVPAILFVVGASATTSASTLFDFDFSLGNTGFTSGYTYQSDLVPEATYFTDVEPDSHNVNWTGPNFGDHTTGTGNMMIVNGASTAGVDVFSTTAVLAPNTTYFLSTWIASVYPVSPAILQFSWDPGGTSTLLGAPFTASTTVGSWEQFFTTFTTGSTPDAFNTFSIVNQNTASSGNDFALDDIVLGTDNPSVPEPSTYAMMAGGLGALLYLRKRL